MQLRKKLSIYKIFFKNKHFCFYIINLIGIVKHVFSLYYKMVNLLIDLYGKDLNNF